MSAGLDELHHGSTPVSELDVGGHVWDFVVLEIPGPEGIPLTSARILSVDGKYITVSVGDRPVISSGKAKNRIQDWPTRVIDTANSDVKITYLDLGPGDVVKHVSSPNPATFDPKYCGEVTNVYKPTGSVVFEWTEPKNIPYVEETRREDVILWYHKEVANCDMPIVHEKRVFRYGGDNFLKQQHHLKIVTVLEVDPTTQTVLCSLGENKMRSSKRYLHYPDLVVGNTVSVLRDAERGPGCIQQVLVLCANGGDSQYAVWFGSTKGISLYKRRELMFPSVPATADTV